MIVTTPEGAIVRVRAASASRIFCEPDEEKVILAIRVSKGLTGPGTAVKTLLVKFPITLEVDGLDHPLTLTERLA